MATQPDLTPSKFWIINKRFLVGLILIITVITVGIVALASISGVYVCKEPEKKEGIIYKREDVQLECTRIR